MVTRNARLLFAMTAAVFALAAPPASAAAGAITIVACAPGYPGTTAEAQPSMDAFAAAVAEAARWPRQDVAANYQETEKGGVARLAQPDVGVALVPLPFLAKYGSELKLEPLLAVEEKGNGLTQRWTLVAKKGRVASAAALARFQVISIAGYAPRFVRGALASWGSLPESTRIAQSSQVLSALRKAAAGDDVAVLLDGQQGASLASLPFAADLETVARSEPLPVAFVAMVGNRIAPARWKQLRAALERLPSTQPGAAALDGIRMVRFVAPDPAALQTARRFMTGRGD